ncbi:MAG: family 16 glycoside hydrolase, partial [Opitutales bacterium]
QGSCKSPPHHSLIRGSLVMALVATMAVHLSPQLEAASHGDGHDHDDDGWVSLFDGETLDGWRASENPDTFHVEDGKIIVDGPRAHLFYEGEVGNADFEDFEIRMDVMTFPQANSGVFFHTEYQETGWPSVGYEVQVNATHGDRIKTGSIYGVQNIMDEAPHEDEEWFNLHFSVRGNRVVVKVDGEVVNDFTETPDDVSGTRRLSSGTVALQGHDPNSVIHFRNIELRELDGAEAVKALYVTGGGWHDYEAQEGIITEGLGSRVNIDWTIENEAGNRSNHWPERFEQDNWAEGYDVVVYNFCITGTPGADHVDGVVDMHADLGVPAVFLHCAIHSFRADTTKWFEFGGVRSHRHEGHRPFHVEVIEADHPIMIGFPEDGWQTPQGELYEIAEVYENTTPLAQAYGQDTERDHIVIWTNEYEGVRVFGTTIGHHNETMEHEVYLDFVSRGLLWAAGKLNDDGEPEAGYAGH